MYKIEQGVPLPSNKRDAPRKLPFADLRKTGDSFFVPLLDMTNNAVKTAAHRYKHASGVKVTVRKVEGGSRVFLL